MNEGNKLKSSDRMLLERVARGPVSYTHAIDMRGTHTKLVRTTLSQSQHKHLHRLAVDGYLAEKITGCGGQGEPPETTVAYKLTALGQAALDIHPSRKPPVNRWTPPTEAEMEKEGLE